MNNSVELPSGKILNIVRFVALIPNSNTSTQAYDLILEGYSGSCQILVINTETRFKAEGRRQKAEVLKPLCHKDFGHFPSFPFCPLPSAFCLTSTKDHQKLPRTGIQAQFI